MTSNISQWNIFNPTYAEGATFFEKGLAFARPISRAIGAVTLIANGAFELYKSINPNPKSDLEAKMLPKGTYHRIHGCLFVPTGVIEGALVLHGLDVINLGVMHKAARAGGSILFLLANIFELDRSIAIVKRILALFPNLKEMPREVKLHLATTISGILGNIGFIAAAALLLFTHATAIAFLIGVVSAFFDGIRSIHQFFRPYSYGG